MAGIEKAFELAIVISAVDHLSPVMKAASLATSAAQKQLDTVTKSMKQMGASGKEIQQVTNQLKALEQSQALSKLTSDMKAAGVESDKIATVAQGFAKLNAQQQKLDKLTASYDKFKKTAMVGGGMTLVGGSIADALFNSLKQAGEFQTQLITIQDITGATTDQMNQLGNSIMDVSTKVSKFNDMQLAGFANKLATGGFNNVNDINKLMLPVSQFAEAQVYEGKQSDPNEAIRQAIEMAHTFKVYDPGQFTQFLDTFNKYSNMQPGDSSALTQTLTYLAPVAQGQLKMQQSDIMALAAIDNRVGLTGSHGGTNAADMILRLIPGLVGGTTPKVTKDRYGNVTNVTYPKALQAMMDMGLADSKGNSKFFQNGQIVNLDQMLQTLIDASKNLSPEKLTQDYKDIFGIQGGRAASLLADPATMEQLQQMRGQLSKTKSMEQIQHDISKSPQGQLDLLKSNSMTAMLRFAQVLGPLLNPILTKMNTLLGQFLKLEQQHPQLMKYVGVFMAISAGVMLVIGPMLTLVGLLGMASTGLMALGVKGGLGAVFKGMGKGIAFPFKAGANIVSDLALKGNVAARMTGGTLARGASAAGRGLATAGEFIGNGAVDIAKWAGSKTLTGIQATGRALSSVATSAAKASLEFGKLAIQVAVASGRFIANAAATIAMKVAQAAVAVATRVWAATQVALNAIMDANPIALIIIEIAALIVVIILLIKYWKQVVAWVEMVASQFTKMPMWLQILIAAFAPFIALPLEIIAHWDVIKTYFTNLVSEMTTFGHNIIDGLKIGLQSGWAALKGVWNDLVSHLPASLAAHLEIHSPSLVMMRMGGYISQGLALGIAGNSSLVSNAANQLGNAAIPDVGGVYGSVGSGGGGNAPFIGELHIHANTAEGGRAAADAFMNQLGRSTRMNNMSRPIGPNRLTFN